ncbi:FecR family protein [Sphingobium ummariense]
MTDEEPSSLTVKQQARRWAMEVHTDPALRPAAMRWCAQSAEHKAEFDISYAAISKIIDPASVNVHDRMNGSPRDSRPRVPSAKLVIAASLAAILLLGAHFVLGQNMRSSIAPPHIASSGAKNEDAPLIFSTRKGEVRKITLADGSVITLDTDSRLLVWLHQERREVTLAYGRAIFAVAHDASRPFTVSADGGTTTALGTRFGVERRAHCQMNVILYEGRVAVTPPCETRKTSAPATKSYLQPGEQIRYSGTSTAVGNAVAEPAPTNDEQWTTGVKSYDDEAVSVILAEVNLYSDVKLVAASPEIGAMRVSAELHIRNPESVAKHLARALGLTVENQGSDRLVLTI